MKVATALTMLAVLLLVTIPHLASENPRGMAESLTAFFARHPLEAR